MSLNLDYDVAIIGGGIIGSAINYELSKHNLNIIQIEKNKYLADETSAGNSGIIHGGYDVLPTKKEAQLNMRGNLLWHTTIFKHLSFPREHIPSLVLAFNDEEIKEVHELYNRGITNGIDPAFIKIINTQEIMILEPHVNPKVQKALYCTLSSIVDPVLATRAFVGAALNNNSTLIKSADVTNLKEINGGFEIEINKQRYITARFIVNAAGHFADQVAHLMGDDHFKQTTVRGQYLILAKDQRAKINNICFLTPTIHGKGVIVAPLPCGRVLAGPTAEPGVAKADARLLNNDKVEMICQLAHNIIPQIDTNRVEKKLAGSRPVDIATNDFVIGPSLKNPNFINVGGIQSPGLSSAPAIAELITDYIIQADPTVTLKAFFKPDYKVIW